MTSPELKNLVWCEMCRLIVQDEDVIENDQWNWIYSEFSLLMLVNLINR